MTFLIIVKKNLHPLWERYKHVHVCGRKVKKNIIRCQKGLHIRIFFHHVLSMCVFMHDDDEKTKKKRRNGFNVYNSIRVTKKEIFVCESKHKGRKDSDDIKTHLIDYF